MTECDVALLNDKHSNFFATMKINNPQQYNYIKSLNKNLDLAYKEYVDKNMKLVDKVAMIYYQLEEGWGKRKAFADKCVEEGLYTNPNSFYAIKRQLFRLEAEVEFASYIKFKEIIKLYKKDKDDSN